MHAAWLSTDKSRGALIYFKVRGEWAANFHTSRLVIALSRRLGTANFQFSMLGGVQPIFNLGRTPRPAGTFERRALDPGTLKKSPPHTHK